jgi:predicted methyltransferase
MASLEMITWRRIALVAVVATACSSSGAGTAEVARVDVDDPPGDAGADSVNVIDPLQQAIDHAERPDEDRARDAERRPREVLAFAGIAPGMVVADLMTGRGYYAEILARVVGPAGRVYAHNTPFVVDRFADEPLRQRLARPGLETVIRLDEELESPGLPRGELDAALMVLFYHDTVWQGVDRAAMNRAIFEALRPGGAFIVIDHHAEEGSGVRDAETLHRIDAEVVKDEILAAGFLFDGESDVLRRDADDRTLNVFDDAIRGKTDRFMYRFRKP